MKKLTRKDIRRIVNEQTDMPSSGPYFVMIVDSNYGEVKDTFITKALPEESWWYDPERGAYTEEDVVNILDMSKKRRMSLDDFPNDIISFDLSAENIRHPDAF